MADTSKRWCERCRKLTHQDTATADKVCCAWCGKPYQPQIACPKCGSADDDRFPFPATCLSPNCGNGDTTTHAICDACGNGFCTQCGTTHGTMPVQTNGTTFGDLQIGNKFTFEPGTDERVWKKTYYDEAWSAPLPSDTNNPDGDLNWVPQRQKVTLVQDKGTTFSALAVGSRFRLLDIDYEYEKFDESLGGYIDFGGCRHSCEMEPDAVVIPVPVPPATAAAAPDQPYVHYRTVVSPTFNTRRDKHTFIVLDMDDQCVYFGVDWGVTWCAPEWLHLQNLFEQWWQDTDKDKDGE